MGGIALGGIEDDAHTPTREIDARRIDHRQCREPGFDGADAGRAMGVGHSEFELAGIVTEATAQGKQRPAIGLDAGGLRVGKCAFVGYAARHLVASVTLKRWCSWNGPSGVSAASTRAFQTPVPSSSTAS